MLQKARSCPGVVTCMAETFTPEKADAIMSKYSFIAERQHMLQTCNRGNKYHAKLQKDAFPQRQGSKTLTLSCGWFFIMS